MLDSRWVRSHYFRKPNANAAWKITGPANLPGPQSSVSVVHEMARTIWTDFYLDTGVQEQRKNTIRLCLFIRGIIAKTVIHSWERNTWHLQAAPPVGNCAQLCLPTFLPRHRRKCNLVSEDERKKRTKIIRPMEKNPVRRCRIMSWDSAGRKEIHNNFYWDTRDAGRLSAVRAAISAIMGKKSPTRSSRVPRCRDLFLRSFPSFSGSGTGGREIGEPTKSKLSIFTALDVLPPPPPLQSRNDDPNDPESSSSSISMSISVSNLALFLSSFAFSTAVTLLLSSSSKVTISGAGDAGRIRRAPLNTRDTAVGWIFQTSPDSWVFTNLICSGERDRECKGLIFGADFDARGGDLGGFFGRFRWMTPAQFRSFWFMNRAWLNRKDETGEKCVEIKINKNNRFKNYTEVNQSINQSREHPTNQSINTLNLSVSQSINQPTKTTYLKPVPILVLQSSL